jgi:transcriptional repressor NF-X1
VALKCNSECAIRQRNARLADALGIDSGRVSRVGVEDWSGEMKGFASANLGFIKVVEGTFKDFIEGGKQSLILPQSTFPPPSILAGTDRLCL